MARIARITQKIFAGSAANNGVFGSGQTGAKTLSNDLPTIMGLAAWASGWLSSVLGASKFPPLEEFQSVEYVHSTQIAYLLQQGIAEYDSGTEYYENNIAVNPGTVQLYKSIVDGNIGHALSNATYWKLLVDLATIGAGNPIYIGGTSTGSGNAQVLATLTPTGFTLTDGFTITFTAGFTNTGATTLNANSTGATAVKKNSGGGPIALTGGEITAGNAVSVTYNVAASAYIITNSGGLLASNNLSDVASASASLSNLGGASTATTITGGGIATGGGSLASNRVITVTAAVKSDQTTATSNTTAVTPAVQQYHPSAVKAWANFNGSSGSVNAGYNVTSVTKNATADYTVNFTTAFANANYAANCTPNGFHSGGAHEGQMGQIGTQSTGTCQVFNGTTNASGLWVPNDAQTVNVTFSGNQ